MDVTSTRPLRVASLVWQPRPGAWVLTVVAKVTFTLRPGESTLAPLQEPTAPDDRHRSDDVRRSLRFSRDVVPVKPGADVTLVGSAFAPDRTSARSVVARLSVGEIDKSIEVWTDRTVGPDGSVREGAPFTQMALDWEQAAGGPGTSNPVGVARGRRDGEGRSVLPNLQKPGSAMNGVFDPVGFGPIAPAWPERRTRLVGAATDWTFADLALRPLPEGMDLAFFNAAPRDQQLRTLGERERITLENLHPAFARLVTTLPGLAPRAVLEGRGGGPQPVAMRADSLWIDTDRGLCTLTFRGMVALQSADEPGRVAMTLESDRPASAGGSIVLTAPREPIDATADIPVSAREAPRVVLPFGGGAPPAAPRTPEPVVMTPRPAPLSQSPWAAPPPSSSMPSSAVVGGPAPGLLDVSNAAASALALAPRLDVPSVRPAIASDVSPVSARARPAEVVELVWFDEESVPRIRRKAPWRPLLDDLERRPLDPDLDDPALAGDLLLLNDHRDVFEIVARGEPTDGDAFGDELAACHRDDGRFVPTLALVAGELELPFDELAALRATLTTVTPLVGQDEALRAAVGAAKEFLAMPGLTCAPAVAEGLTRRVEDAFAQGKRAVPAGYLEAQRERVLLEQRQYQRRAVFGGKHLRGLLDLGPAGKRGPTRVPAYLPESAAELMPMASRFRVRLVAELRLSIDRYEVHPASLRVLALGRLVPAAAG